MKNLLLLTLTLLAYAGPASAIHIYAGYECSGKDLKLNYDGPGSNYAVGGFSHFYSKKSPTERVLSIENFSEGNQDDGTIGDVIGEEPLGVIFEIVSVKTLSHGKPSLKVGDKCEPEEFDYQSTTSKTVRVVEIKKVSSEATQKLGLRVGQKIRLSCNESLDMPVKCPESGAYGKDDIN